MWPETWFYLGDGIRPSRVLDRDAARRLKSLLAPAVAGLKRFDCSPALIAEYYNKYSDPLCHDCWYGVQLGMAVWEQSQFFGSERPKPYVTESQWFRPSPRVRSLDQPVPANVASDLLSARELLNGLHERDWRQAVVAALEGYDLVLCLMVTFGQPWLCRTSPIDGEGEAWIWNDDGEFAHFGICSRIDNELGPPCILYLQSINPDAFPLLNAEAKRHFAPEPADLKIYCRLSALIRSAASDVAAITGQPVTLCSAGSRGCQYDAVTRSDRTAKLAWQGYTTKVVVPGDTRRNYRTNAEEPYPEEVYRLSLVMGRLEDADWREMFGWAFGLPLVDPQVLALYVEGDRAFLVRDNTVLKVDQAGLIFAGLCDYPQIEPRIPYMRLPKTD